MSVGKQSPFNLYSFSSSSSSFRQQVQASLR